MTITINISKPSIKSLETLLKARRYNKMIEASQKKLAEVPQASYYSQIWA